MTSRPVRKDPLVRWAWPVAALGLGIGLLWAYWPTLGSLVERWSYDPRYSHGWIVPLFALLVLWFRRDQAPALSFQSSWWGVGFLVLGGILRLLGAYYYIFWFDEISLLPSLTGACLLLGSWPLLGWCWPALALFVFMVPLPYVLETGLAHPLQRLATVASTYVLQTLGFPAVPQGNVILIDDLEIGILEACSGLGMLMTFFALSTAVAFIIRRPFRDKLVIFISAIPIGVLVNLFRITVTGVLLCTVGRYWANLVFHDLAGWLMMPVALALLWLELQFLKKLFIPARPTGPIPVSFSPPPSPAATAPPPGANEVRPMTDPQAAARAGGSLLEIQ
jgi:exosortase